MRNDIPERELVERHLAGDRSAMAGILDAYEGGLLRYARALLGDDALAQDAVQETFLRFLREGERMREVRALFPWFLSVTRNLCRDVQRKEIRMERKHEEAGSGPAVAPAEAAVMNGEVRDRVRDVVSGLPEPQREVLRLKLWEGLTYKEIGARMGMTLTNVSYHLGQAVRAVGGKLKAEGIGA